ncbi:MAG: hypothetical protein PF795_03135 [Kiritimatiellae bacterium]|jgi:hypothetical protein|nr:hypothetical protein [Kiritimatiellia bacterium]
MSNETERKDLQNWLVEYELYQQMRLSVDDEICEAVPLDFSGEPPPCEGQIRLWPAKNLADEPVYALLMRGGYGQWRLLPFSPLALPAVPEELRVREEGPVRVIQGWNSKTVSTSRVESSWCVCELEEDVRFRVNSWLLAIEKEGCFPETLPAYIGPPLHHPLDPRHEYREDEQRRVDYCLGESLPAVDSDAPDLDIAAEPEAGYGDQPEDPE